MLPVLFTLAIPAALGKALACAVAAAVVLGRAHAYRRAPGEGTPSWGAALWDDRLTIGALAIALGALWRAGALAGPLSLPLHTYGVMIATGFVVAIALAQREARRRGQDAHAVSDLAFWIIVSALAGSRLYYIAVNAGEYVGPGAWVVAHGVRIPRVLAVWEGGLVFYGGFIGATLAAWWFMRRKRLAFLPYADTIIPSLAVGHFFGRLGCFAAGCCWGSVSHAHLPWLARFPPESLAYQTFARRADAASFLAADGLTTLPVHPTQLYESFGELALFALLVLVVRPRRRFDGQVLATWLIAYAVLRGVVELFRGDVERGVFGGLGVGQWTSVAILAVGAAVWALGRRRASRGDRAGPALAA